MPPTQPTTTSKPSRPAILYRDRRTTTPSTSQPYYLPPSIDPTPYLSLPPSNETITAHNLFYNQTFAREIPYLNDKLSHLKTRRILERERLYGTEIATSYTPNNTPEDVRRSCFEGRLETAQTAFHRTLFWESKRHSMILLRQADCPDDLLFKAFQLVTRIAEKIRLSADEMAVYAEVKGILERLGLLEDAAMRRLRKDAAKLCVREDSAVEEERESSSDSEWVFE